MDLADVTLATFEPLLGEPFAIDAGGVALQLMLDAADALDEWPGGRQPFRLTFRGPADPLLAQATYRLEHAGLGALEIFIVPISCDGAGATYEAIFT